MIRRPPRSTLSSSSAASDVYKRQPHDCHRGRPNHRPNHRPWPVALRQRYAILPALRRRAALRPVPTLLWLRVPPGGLPRSPGRIPAHRGTAARAAAPHSPHLHRGLRMSWLRPTSRRRTPLPRLPAVRPPHRRRRKLYRLRGGAHRHGTTRARIDPSNCPTPPLPSLPRGASAPVIYTADWTRPWSQNAITSRAWVALARSALVLSLI